MYCLTIYYIPPPPFVGQKMSMKMPWVKHEQNEI